MVRDAFFRQLKRLLIGLADQQILVGNDFHYGGGKLYADEVGDLMLASVLCIAQELAVRLGLGAFGCEFSLGGEPGRVPLTARRLVDDKRFVEVAPLVVEVFEGEVMDCRGDLARLFEAAARVIDVDFNLVRDTNYGMLAA